MSASADRSIALWLFSCAGLVFAMTIVGAITRLTGSGLSIVVWQPLIGALPPMSESAWTAMFDLYKQSPEFIHRNSWMDLSDFKAIFFWEWGHRLLGRLIGLAYALPLVWFTVRRQIPSGKAPVLWLILALGGVQGGMGWYMVSSGLVDRPDVSHFRLAAHLGLAVLLYGLMVWAGRDIQTGRAPVRDLPAALRLHGWIGLYAVILTMIWGAFTAGLDAGLVYNSFPRMGDGIIPPEIGAMKPGWVNIFHNPVAVQFTHRWMGVVTALILVGYSLHAWRAGAADARSCALGAMAVFQAGLGISTLLLGVPVWLAALHQGGALVLLTLLLL